MAHETRGSSTSTTLFEFNPKYSTPSVVDIFQRKIRLLGGLYALLNELLRLRKLYQPPYVGVRE